MNIKALNAQMRKDYHAAGYTGKNIIFAVLDTGAEPVGRLRGKVIKRMGDEPRSDHGTFVASIVNEYCPDAEIWSYRCDYPVNIIEALHDVVARAMATNKRVIVNMSLETDNANIKDAVDACVAAGIPLVCAAGNDGHEALYKYPTCFESPITVAALQADSRRAYFSTWHNEVDFSDFGQWVEGLDAEGNIVTKSGTSFASPQVAGKIGLLLSAHPNMTEPEVYEALKGMAVDLDKAGRDPLTGYGFVQLAVLTQKEEPKEEPVEERILKLIDKPRMQGDDVKELQTLLDKHGIACSADGVFGPATSEAVKSFQKANNLPVTGEVDKKTWEALRAEPIVPTPPEPEPEPDDTRRKLYLIPRPRMEGDDVREVQERLNVHNIVCDIDGVFGPATDAAVRAFQQAEGIAVNGVVNDETWVALQREPDAPSPKQELVKEFIQYLYEQLCNVYVWGGNGQTDISEFWIKRCDTSASNAQRSIVFWQKQLSYGAKNLRAFDCSGLISRWMQDNGYVSSKQNCDMLYARCTPVSMNELKPGDLLFRYKTVNGKRDYHHVGVYVGRGLAIEAKGRDDGVVIRPLYASGKSYWECAGRLKIFM